MVFVLSSGRGIGSVQKQIAEEKKAVTEQKVKIETQIEPEIEAETESSKTEVLEQPCIGGRFFCYKSFPELLYLIV